MSDQIAPIEPTTLACPHCGQKFAAPIESVDGIFAADLWRTEHIVGAWGPKRRMESHCHAMRLKMGILGMCGHVSPFISTEGMVERTSPPCDACRATYNAFAGANGWPEWAR